MSVSAAQSGLSDSIEATMSIIRQSLESDTQVSWLPSLSPTPTFTLFLSLPPFHPSLPLSNSPLPSLPPSTPLPPSFSEQTTKRVGLEQRVASLEKENIQLKRGWCVV